MRLFSFSPRRPEVIRGVVGVGLAAVCTWLAVRSVDLPGLADALAKTNIVFVVLGIVSVLFTTWFKAGRWSALAGLGLPGSLLLFPALVIGQMVNTLVPARLGEVPRILIGAEAGQRQRSFLIGSIALEKVLDAIALAVTILLLLPFIGQELGLFDRGLAAVIGSLGLAAVVLVAVSRGDWLLDHAEHWAGRWFPRRSAQFIAIARGMLHGLSALRDRRVVFASVIWTALAWVAAVTTNVIVFWAIGLERQDLVLAASLLVVGQIGGAVPVAPGRLGVFHALMFFTLTAFGVPQAPALAYAVILHIVVFGTQIVLGLALLARESVAGARRAKAGVSAVS